MDGFSKPQISWFKDERHLIEEAKATLVKRGIKEEGEGTYTCVAKDEGGCSFDRFYIIVDGKKERNASQF